MLSVVLLVACVAIAIGTILYLFFWNRIFGWILGVLVRLGLWTQDSSAIWVDFGSAHLSLISGRILLRDVRYHSCNQTVRIVKCQLSWRWWIRRVAEEEDLADGRSDGAEHAPRCRIHVSMEGLEWFMYNRTASFDNILSQLAAANPELAGVRTKSRESNLHSIDHSIVHDEKHPRLNVTGRRALATFKLPSFVGKLSSWIRTQLPDLDPKNLLPLSFSVDKGAITMGNHTTENLLLGQFASAAGTYGIVQPRSKLDDYKQMLRITFKDAGISFVENPDYWTSNTGIGKSVNETFTESESITGVIMVPLNYSDFKKLWTHARKHFPFFKSRGRYYVKPDKERKKKGKKDSEEMSHVGADFSALEYAIERKLLETPTLELLYYADVAGPVPSEPIGNLDRDSHGGLKNPKGIEFMDIGNADLPPEWGVDVVVHGGSFRYGPWADRQRAQLQRVFFPQTFQAIEPSTMLLPRDQRTCTCLKLFFEFRGVTTLHIPFREPSKNWQWDGLVDFPRTRKQREAASIQLRVGDKSSLKYLVPMIATVEGYIAELDVFMDDITVTSSLNDIRLLEAYSCSVKSLLPSPLRWNSERSWDFNVSLDKPTLYIIRDHVNMLTDLGKDWSTGPTHDFHTFVPIIYSLNLNLHDFELNLYANDHNIIDRPLDRRENVLFTLKGDVLRSITTVPSNKFRPLSTKASFSIVAPDVAVTLTLPRWNTHGLVPSSVRQLTNFGQVGLFRLDGSYMYHAEVRDDCVDQLKLDVQIPSTSLKLFGWIVRHTMVLRENYFGGFTQYSTTREYLGKREGGIAVGDPLDLKYRPGKSNVFHLDLSVTARDGTIVLPAGVIGFERAQQDCSDDVDLGSCAVIAIRELQVQLRLHDFFMEMSFNVDPVVVSIVNSCPDRLLLSHAFKTPKEQLSISGLHITANRLFGPQPHTTTYVCIWSISIGDVKGSLSTMEAQILLAAGKSFGHGFVDPFNAPAAEYVVPAERDATFLKVAVNSVDLSWKNEAAVIRVDIKDGVQFAYNNIAGTRHRKLTTVAIPTVDIQMLLTPGTAKQCLEVGRFRTGVSLGLYSAPKGWREDAQIQKSFLRTQDSQTHRFATIMGLNSQFSPVRWSNTLYLQSIYAPRVSSSSRKTAVRVGIDASPPPTRRPFRKDVINSDSEDDYLISEADRDERLANSRPTSSTLPLDRPDAEQSSSAFDESDENGGSDSESSWSDYFELEDGVDPRIPYLAFCRKLSLRHQSPEMDCHSEFVLGRENPVLQTGLFSDESLHTAKLTSDIDSKKSVPALPDDENRTYTCVDVQHSSAFLTPLCLTALKEILEQHNIEERGPELRLDELMLDRISSVAESSISVYNARVRSLKLRVVHEIADLLKLHAVDEPLTPTRRAFAVSNVGIEELHGLISLPSSKRTTQPGHATFGRLSVNRTFGSVGFLYTSSSPTKHDIQVPSVAVDFSMARFAAAFVKLRLQASYDNSELRICRSAPDVVLAAVNSLEHPLKELWSAETNHSSQIRLQKKQLVYTILAHSGNRMSTDLLSSVQPAFFVQKGRPQQLRSDDSWKLLFHLRHSLTSMSAQEYNELKRGLNTIATSTDMDTLVQTRQVPWAMEEGLPLIKVELIETLFAKQTRLPDASLDKHDNRPLKSMGFQAGSLCLVLDSGDSLARSSVTIQGVDFRADLLTRRMLFEPRTLSPQSSTIRSFRPTSEYVDYGSISLVTALDVDSLQITIFPSIIEMLQNALRAWRTRPRESDLQVTEGDKGTPSSMSNSYIKEFFDNRVFVFDVRATLHHILVETAAENIVFEIASRGFSVGYVGHATKPLEGSSFDLSLSHTGGFDKFEVKARTRTFEERGTNTLASITLASITMTKSLSVLLFQYHAPHGSTLRGTVHATSLELNVPRSAIRLYKFMEQWRQDYLLGLDTMLKSLFSEIKQGPDRSSKPSKVEKRRMGINLHASVKAASVVLQVMHGTWLAWTTNGVLGYFTEKSGEKGIIRSGGLQIESHSLRISSTSADWSSQRPTKIVLDLPSITGSGSFDTEGSSFLIALGFLTVTIKPSHWDSLLSVQQKFGQDFNDLILILGDARSKQPKSRRERPSSRRDTVPFYVTAKLAGFKIGMEGPFSTQFLECTDIDATVSHSGLPQWSVTLTDLALYLSPKSLAKEKLAHLDRGQLPVLVSIDLQAVSRGSPSQGQDRRLSLDITKLHAILQAHLMGDIGDFIDYLQGELMHRKENRAAELRGFKEKARNVMTTFNLYPRRSSIATRQKFLDKSSIAISISNLGAAFPLDLTRRRARKLGLDQELTTKALLLSIKTFKFETQRGESGEAVMEGFCFQFVSRFDPSNPEDFTARRHHTLNQMLYPQMTARMRTETSSSTRRIYASAAVSGFILDLDSSITLYIFSLVDAYQHGRQRMEQLAAGLPRSGAEVSSPTRAQASSKGRARKSVVTSSIEADLRFQSGLVRMHCTSKDSSAFTSISPDWTGQTYQILDSDAELFRLPELTVFAEYHADVRQLGTSTEDGMRAPVLVFRSTVHSSHNSLRPLLLSFVSGVVHNVEERMKQASNIDFRPPSGIRQSLSTASVEDTIPGMNDLEDSLQSNFQLFISLRIDKSRLELTCRPDVNVIAGLNWESGGFVLNMGPGAKGVSLSASIEGLTIGLKHGFLSDDSAHIDARNLIFSTNFSKSSLSSGGHINSISVVVDTEFSGGIRFSRYQDFLCFKAVWLDNIPVFTGDGSEIATSPSRLSAVSSVDQAPKQGFDTAILIRVRHIKLDADLGQSISFVIFDLQDALIRARLTSECTELSISFDRVELQAKGNLSGHLRMPDFAFRTIRRRYSSVTEKQPLSRMLELNLTSGTLDVQLQSDWLWLLQYRAEPLEAQIYDDWSTDADSTEIRNRQLHLYFSVSGSKVMAMMTIMAIPKLLMYAGKLKSSLEAQREGASRESSAFRSTRLPRPDNALSEVANAMFRSARSKLKESESLSYVINQHMKLQLSELVFVVLPRSQGDNELARFIGRNVMAQLERTVQQIGLPGHRDLQLSLTHMSISQLLKQGFDPRLPGQEFDVLTTSGRNLSGTENLIFSLPAMDMRMITDEGIDEGSRVLPYDFTSKFARQGDQRGENIHISFNIRLYSWLTILRKTFARELKRAQEAADWKTVNVSPASLTAPKFANPDTTTPPFTFGSPSDGSSSPAESRPPSRHSSRPSSPVRSRSVESVLLSTPSRSQGSQQLVVSPSPRFGISDTSKVTEQRLGVPSAQSPPTSGESSDKSPAQDSAAKKSQEIIFVPRSREIERLTVKQLGEATPDVMHPFFTRKAGFNLEEALPQYVHEYATLPIEILNDHVGCREAAGDGEAAWLDIFLLVALVTTPTAIDGERKQLTQARDC
ncbi:uncharacterized protein FOMMEDRAFT_146573 [Fomitiporia mediterranea MF3/22]|uniref:uncharacterized protein n=1 Tax=Fomitiporia mediterranea (strain MF3/22) TaxID=694068 RepID=UPI0004408AB3|nr:uncharacterized protein FOMMEDRAFT_146573 [Fomitiporia mediterranea MF3/22]EJD02702.1 hypothetical protein FOMMEDRAFT_146573 [Fomitiporia mediterranea MF3/22]